MKYLSTFETAEKWGISHRRVSVLCNEGRITGEFRTSDITKEEIGWYMTGHREGKEAAKI